MHRYLLISGCAYLALCCGNAKDSKEALSAHTAEDLSEVINNFGVTWHWLTSDTAKVTAHALDISTELTRLWKRGLVENVYYDAEATERKLADFPNVAFFLKVGTEAQARIILDDLTVVSKDIASYTLHPVGNLWLSRPIDRDVTRAGMKSFIAIWTTRRDPHRLANAYDVLKMQSEAIVGLWKEGKVENVYFDIEGTYTSNNTLDFVFFVNATNISAADSICQSLPFFINNIATYEIHQAGVFWMGIHQDQSNN